VDLEIITEMALVSLRLNALKKEVLRPDLVQEGLEYVVFS